MMDLTSPFSVRSLHLRNRLVMPPMATEQSADGQVTEALLSYYKEKSKGGWLGLVITEHAYVAPAGKASPGQLSLARDEDIAGLSRLVKVLHKNGVPVAAQISHAGAAASSAITGCPTWAPSLVLPQAAREAGAFVGKGLRPRLAEKFQDPALCDRFADREFAAPDLETLIQDFAQAARRAREAGYDAVEIHSAHGYLLNQFYSPLTNGRHDAWGGTSDRRVRLHRHIIRAVRAAVGGDYPILLRLGAVDDLPGGATVDDACTAADLFRQEGVDMLDISGGITGFNRPEHMTEQGWFAPEAAAVRASSGLPVIMAGGIRTAQAADRLIRDGKCDFAAVGRALLADSDWPRKCFEALK
jgi:NADPH2 dehydrogenase